MPTFIAWSIDAWVRKNVDLLIPGNWTWPAPGTGRLEFACRWRRTLDR